MFFENIGRTIGDIFGLNKKKRPEEQQQPRPQPVQRPQPFNTGVSAFNAPAFPTVRQPQRPSAVGQPIQTADQYFERTGRPAPSGSMLAANPAERVQPGLPNDQAARAAIMRRVQQQAGGTPRERAIEDVPFSLEKIGQGLARVPETVVRSGAQLVDKGFTGSDQGYSQTGENEGLRRALYGKAPISSYQKQGVEGSQAIKDATGLDIPAPLVGAGAFALDVSLPTIGKAVTSVGKPGIAAAIKAVKPSAVETAPILEKAIKEAVVASPPQVVKPTVQLKGTTSIDPTDPFGNRNILTRIRNEAGSLVDDDAQMIKLLGKVEKETGRKGLVDQWYFDTGNVRASNAMANAKLRRSPELRGAIGGLNKGGLKEFDKYTAARAELKNYEGLPTSQTPAELQKTVSELGPKYEQRFGELNGYYKNLAQQMHAGGLIDDTKLQKYLASDDYVRIQRDMEDLVGNTFGGSKSRSLGTTTATQKRKGSAREILSPTSSAAKRTQDIQLEINRNKAATNTINVLQDIGLAKPVKNVTNKNTISRLVNGKREIYEVPGDIKQVVDNVSPYQLGVISQIISAPTRMLRAGTTGLSAPFAAVNYLRDQGSSALYSKSVLDTHNPANIIAGLRSATKDVLGGSNDPLWQKFEQFAGDQTVFDELRNVKNTNQMLREVRLGGRGQLGNAVASPVRTVENLIGITEKATRFQNFKGIYQKTLKATGNEEEAVKQAVLAARQNSVDFQRSSNFTRMANLFIPFFNAGTQGSRNVLRSFRDRPVATAAKSLGTIVLPTMAATMWNLSDPTRREAYDSISDFEKEDNFIIVTPDAKQRDDGSWEGIIKIPKPQGYRELTDPARDVTEAFLKNEPVENVAKMFTDTLGGITGPLNVESPEKAIGSVIPQQAKPWIQLAMNKDLYSGNEIVPEFMQEGTDDPTKRRFKGTSGSAQLIANQLGVSPIQVEKAINDVFGSLGRYGTNVADTTLAAAGAIPQDQIGGRSAADDFSRRLFEARGELLDKNKSGGQKYYEDIKTVTQGLDKNELAAFNSVHPSKTNFLGEEIFDENKRIANYTRAGAYLNNPGTLEADRKLDQLQRERGKPGNPLFELPKPLLTKALLKSALPPGAKDPELSNLYKEPWYQDYQNARSKYYDQIKQSMQKEGKVMPKSTNPYPETPANLQKVMDTYSSLPKGTGERSAWIAANPGLFQQMTSQWSQVDAWENKERVAIGLAPIEGEATTGGKGGGGGRKGSGLGKSTYAYAVSASAGGKTKAPKVSAAKPTKAITFAKAGAKPKVSIKKALT